MSEDDSRVVLKIGLPWIAVAIGGLSAWIIFGTMESILLGCLMGVIVSLASYSGFIPIGGVFIYHLLVNILFTWTGMQLPLLYLYGLIWSIIYTVIAIIVLIAIVLDS